VGNIKPNTVKFLKETKMKDMIDTPTAEKNLPELVSGSKSVGEHAVPKRIDNMMN
jgi:hypothetical protein